MLGSCRELGGFAGKLRETWGFARKLQGTKGDLLGNSDKMSMDYAEVPIVLSFRVLDLK